MSTAVAKFSAAAQVLHDITYEDKEQKVEAVFCRLHGGEYLGKYALAMLHV
jgi:hypothetical protein